MSKSPRHRAVRRWPWFWRRRCACGVPWWPCMDAPAISGPGAHPVVRPAQAGNRPAWAGPTLRQLPTVAPLMTRGQRTRYRKLR